MLHILLNYGISELSSDQSFGIENGVGWILGNLVFGSISNKSLVVIEGNIGWGGSISLIIGNDLNSIVLPDSDTGVGSTEIDSNSFFRDSFITHFVGFCFNYKFLWGKIVFNG